MGKIYNQLDLDERIELDRLRDAGHSLRRIGTLMNRSHTTLSRELRRNMLPKAGYKRPALTGLPGHDATATVFFSA